MLEFINIEVSGNVYSTDAVSGEYGSYVMDRPIYESKIDRLHWNNSTKACSLKDMGTICISLKNLSENEINAKRIYLQYCIDSRGTHKVEKQEWRKGYVILPDNIKDLVNGTTDIPVKNDDIEEKGHNKRAQYQIYSDIVMFKPSNMTGDEYYQYITGRKFGN